MAASPAIKRTKSVSPTVAAYCRGMFDAAPWDIDDRAIAKKLADEKFSSQAEIAEIFGVTKKTVGEWIHYGMPGSTGNFPAGGVLVHALYARAYEAAVEVGMPGFLVRLYSDQLTTRDELRARVIHGPPVSSIREVAEYFNVSAGTVRQSWRQNGMPGEPGRWFLGDIWLWKFQREREQLQQREHGRAGYSDQF